MFADRHRVFRDVRAVRRGRAPSVAAVAVHHFRGALPHHAHHQHLPVLRDDVLVRAHRGHREGAQHHRGLRPLPELARLTVRFKVEAFTNISHLTMTLSSQGLGRLLATRWRC